MDWKIIFFLVLIIEIEFVYGEGNDGIFVVEFFFVSMLIIVLFCFGGVYLCLYFICCYEYLCIFEENVGCCGDFRNGELEVYDKENGNVKKDFF